ncbi:MAG: ABC transporter ATP-binding protein [Zestosphaera sp.]
MASVAMRMENVVKRFEDVTALDGVTLEVFRGEIFGLLGPNGAGKTTTVNILTGHVRPTSGRAVVLGHDVTVDVTRIKGLIGVCPQETAVYHHLTGWENIELFGDLHLLNREVVKTRGGELIRKMSLEHDIRRKTAKYSGGMRRRLSLVLALIHDPEMVFLDEPTVGMDPQSRRAVWDLVRGLRNAGKTVFLTTHYMEEAEELCDRVGVIDHGRVIALDTPRRLIAGRGVRNLEEVFIALTGRRIREEI